jgi:hypothetical protein
MERTWVDRPTARRGPTQETPRSEDPVGLRETVSRRLSFGLLRAIIAFGAGVVVVLLALVAWSAFGPGSTNSAVHPPPQVAVFGDSLAWEANPYFVWLVQGSGESALTYDSYGGTAICDWFARMREVESMYHPKAVELEFSGNAFTPCMEGYTPGTSAYYEKYRADTETAIDIFVPGGAHVFLIGAPITQQQQESVPNWDQLNLQYAEIALGDPRHVTYVDAGTAVEGPNHTFTSTLPCLADEPCTGPRVDGVPSNVVRSPDGTHFCPVEHGNEEGVISGCPVYSSGAFRYANAMFEALTMPTGSATRP